MSEHQTGRQVGATRGSPRRAFLQRTGLQAAGASLGALGGWEHAARAGAGPQFNASPPKTKMMLCVDYNDLVASNEKIFDETLIDRFFALCAQRRIERIYWRVSATGNVLYHSRVRTVFSQGPAS